MADLPDVTVTIVSWNTRELLLAALRSIEGGARTTSVEVHVVDNASTDGSQDAVRTEFPDVRLIENDDNLGFARATNLSWPHALGRYWFLLNSDAELRPGALDDLVDFLDGHARAGLATARVVSADGSSQHCAQAVPSVGRVVLEMSRLHKLLPVALREQVLLGPYFGYDRAQRLGWTWGTALLCRREAVEEVGLLSERFFLYGEDLEWCTRMRKRRWEVWFCPRAVVVHHGAASSAGRLSDDERTHLKLDAIYEAIACHRGRANMGALHLVSALAGSIEWVTAGLRRRSTRSAKLVVGHHLGALGLPVPSGCGGRRQIVHAHR